RARVRNGEQQQQNTKGGKNGRTRARRWLAHIPDTTALPQRGEVGNTHRTFAPFAVNPPPHPAPPPAARPRNPDLLPSPPAAARGESRTRGSPCRVRPAPAVPRRRGGRRRPARWRSAGHGRGSRGSTD